MSRQDSHRQLVTVVLPAYNEDQILRENVLAISDYLVAEQPDFDWEIILVNDGSSDNTGRIADDLAGELANLVVIHHPTNFGLGQAFKSAFARSRGDYVITMDVDLSYSPSHIGILLDDIHTTRARLVLASPYMSGGKLTNVPWLRKFFSIWGNKFLAFFAGGHLSTITCMVRAYDGVFIRSLVLRSTGMEIMPEIVYKSMLLRARIHQVPAHLDWSQQVAGGAARQSSMKVAKHVMRTIISGFIFRPFMFFLLPGLALLIFSAWVNVWMFIHFFDALAGLPDTTEGNSLAAAISIAYKNHPHTYIVGLLGLMLSIQLIGLGTLALQSKKYFEETFYLGETLKRQLDAMLQARESDDGN